MKYRKKPVEIEAVQFAGDNMKECVEFIGDNYDNALNYPNIKTLEGTMRVSDGDFIIKGIQGEFYPCKPDIFEQTYDLVKELPEGASPSPHGEPEPVRFRLPDTRTGPTVKFTLSEDGVDEKGKPIVVIVDGYFTVNTYPDGMPGEIWITINKPGDTVQGFANCWAIAMSMLLQFGVHPQKLYDKFKLREFQPNGISQVKDVPIAKSLVDLIIRWMEVNLAPTARPVTPEDELWMKSVEEVVS